jgi:ubiquinone/menaquinone biosynthesis C-methylase UbiE
MATWWDRAAGFYDRFVIVFDWHKDQLRVAGGITSGSVLEVCCGTAYLTRELLKRGVDAYGTDIAPKMSDRARKNLAAEGLDPERVSVADVADLPFEDGQYDYVISTGALGLLSRKLKHKALAEMVRVCRKEVRLLEPIEKREGFYWGRVWTLMVDGHRPIPKRILDDLGLNWCVEWDTMWSIFSYARVWRR